MLLWLVLLLRVFLPDGCFLIVVELDPLGAVPLKAMLLEPDSLFIILLFGYNADIRIVRRDGWSLILP